MRVYLDIETIPGDKQNPAVRQKIDRDTEEEYLKLSLEPAYGRILCIGVIIEEGTQLIHRGTLGRSKQTLRFHLDEAKTLRSFWKLISHFDAHRDLLIGFNLLDFDLRWLFLRSIINHVKPALPPNCFARYRSQPVYDVMWEFTNWRNRISLDEVAKILGLESSKHNGIDGSHVYDLFSEDRHQEICEYALRDVDLARQIYFRLIDPERA